MIKTILAFIIIDISPLFFTSTYLSSFKNMSWKKSHYEEFLKDSVVFDHLVTAMVYETRDMHY